MSLKARARNRVILLLVGLLVIALLGGGLVEWRHYRTEQVYARMRQRGMDAAAAGEDQKVVDNLRLFLRRYPNDVDALAAYAHSLPRIQSASAADLSETQRVLKNLLRLAPDRITERRQLMMIYMQFGMMTEANEQAEAVLASVPDDADAMDVEVSANMGLHHYERAQEIAAKRLKVAPTDWAVQMNQLQVLSQLGQTPDQIMAAAKAAVAGHEGDQGAKLVKGYAYELTNDLPDATATLHSAATQPITDKTVAMNLVTLLDGMGLHQDSMRVLVEMAQNHEPGTVRLLLHRFWEDERFANAVQLAEDPKAAPSLSDSDSQGILADALRRVGKGSESSAIRAKLAGLKNDAMAAAWVAIENAIDTPGRQTSQAARDMCAAALQKAPRNPYMFFFQGAAEAQLGEINTAIELWGNAAQLSRTWALPLLNQTEALLSQNRVDEAERAAAQACRRAPNSTAAAVVLCKVWAQQVNAGATDATGKLNDLIDEVQKVDPGEVQTLTIRVALLAKAGNTAKATDTLRSILNQQPPPSATVLLGLSNVSRQYKLGVEQECLDAINKQFGRTPESALSEALDDFKKQRTDEGLKLLQTASAGATGETAVGFQTAIASYLEATGDAGARAAWQKLGDGNPSDLAVQRAILTSKAAYGDRTFYSRTIDRVRAMTGDQSISWKLAKARWILDGPTDAQSTADATSLLSDVLKSDANSVAANLLMSMAKEKAGDISGATEQMQTAQRLDPKSTLLAMDMAKMLQVRGDFDAAQQQLNIAAGGQNATPDQLLQTAAMLADQGNMDQAIKILEPLAASAKATEPVKLSLASLYCRTKQFDKAQSICDELLKAPDIYSLRLGAQIAMFERKPAEAKAMLGRLNELKMAPVEVDLTRGNFYFDFGQVNEAMGHFKDATRDAPDNAAAWLSVVDCQAATGDSGAIAATVAEAIKHVPDDAQHAAGHAQLIALSQQGDLLARVGTSRTEVRLLPMVVKDATPSDPPVMTLRAIEDSEAPGVSPSDALQSLYKLSQDLPRFWPAQTALTEAQLRYGRCEDAVQTASRAAASFPTDPWPAELATEALASLGRWDEALRMSKTWHDRVIGDPMAADMRTAEIQLSMGDAQGAIATVDPYLTAAELQPNEKWAVLFVEARALLAQKKPDDAARLLWPMVQSTPQVRPAWINFAAGYLPKDAAEAWLGQIGTLLTSEANSQSQQIELAQAWNLLAERTGDKKYAQTARQMVQQVAQSPVAQTSAMALFTQGMFLEEDKDVKDAEAAYRSCLSKANIPAAANNLAMLLANNGGDLNEAVNIAQQCVKADPRATYYDTLADILGDAKKYDQAIDAMQTALRLEPDNAKWHVNMAKLLVASGKQDQAKLLIAELDLMTPGVRSLNAAYQQQLDTLRRQVNTPAASTTH